MEPQRVRDEEAELLFPVEDALNDELAGLGIRSLGRLRNGGAWQLTYLGSPALLERVERIAEGRLKPAQREFSTYSKSDPQWEYYTEFLYPSDERMRWIQDRRVVDSLAQHGDPLTERRRVDHWCYFPDAKAQSSFAAQVVANRFEVLEPLEGEPTFPVQVHRVDSVQLEDIHEVTGWLTELAERCGGDYDGWETFVDATTN